ETLKAAAGVMHDYAGIRKCLQPRGEVRRTLADFKNIPDAEMLSRRLRAIHDEMHESRAWLRPVARERPAIRACPAHRGREPGLDGDNGVHDDSENPSATRYAAAMRGQLAF